MRIKWNRQLDGSLTNRPDGDELPSTEDPQGGAKSHNSPKFFRIFRRKNRRQPPDDGTKDFNCETAPPYSQAPSEMDESDCASISSVATIASQPVTDVCQRDRTLSLFSSFRLSLPGGRKKSKRAASAVPSEPPFHAKELENNRYSSPDLRKGKLDNYRDPDGFSKSSTFVGETSALPEKPLLANSGDVQSLGELRAETLKSFERLKSESTRCVAHEPKLSKSVSFSDCQTRGAPLRDADSPLIGKFPLVNNCNERKNKSFARTYVAHSCDTPRQSSDVKYVSSDSCGPLFPIHPSPESNKRSEFLTGVRAVVDTNNEANNDVNKSRTRVIDSSEKRISVISDAKKKYFSHRSFCKRNKISNLATEYEHETTVLKPNGNCEFYYENFSIFPDNSNERPPVHKKLDDTSKFSVQNDEKNIIADGERIENCETSIESLNVSKNDSEIQSKVSVINGESLPFRKPLQESKCDTFQKYSDSVVPNVENSDKIGIINGKPSTESIDKQKKYLLVCDIGNTNNVCVSSKVLPCDTVQEQYTCDSTLIEKKDDYSVYSTCDSIESRLKKQPSMNNNIYQSMDTSSPDKVSPISNHISENSNNSVENYVNINNNQNQLFKILSSENVCLFTLPNEEYEHKQMSVLSFNMPGMHLDYLNNNCSFLYKLSNQKYSLSNEVETKHPVDSVSIWNAAFVHDLHQIDEIDSMILDKLSVADSQNSNKTTPNAPDSETSHFDSVSDTCLTDSRDFSTREKNQERCPSYYSMSVRPAGSPSTGVTLSESDLLAEINDTPQFSEDKGGSINTKDVAGTVGSVGCPPFDGQSSKMLSNIEFAPYRVDTFCENTNGDVDECDLLTLQRRVLNVDKCDRVSCDYPDGVIADTDFQNEHSVESYSVSIESSINKPTDERQNQTDVVTPVFSQYSDYFSMQEENSSVDNSFTTGETTYSNNATLVDDVENSDATLSTTFYLNSSSPSPECIELDQNSYNDLEKNTDTYSRDANFVGVPDELPEDSTYNERSPVSSDACELSKCHIRIPVVHFNERKEIQRPRRKNSSENDGISLIPSLRRNRFQTGDKKSLRLPNGKAEITNSTNTPAQNSKHPKETGKNQSNGYHHVLKEGSITNGRSIDKLSKHKSEELLSFIDINTFPEDIRSRLNSTSESASLSKNTIKTHQENVRANFHEISSSENLETKDAEKSDEISVAFDNSDSFCVSAPSERSSNATLDEISVSEIYSAPLNEIVSVQGKQECGLQTRCASLPAVVGQVQLPSTLKELLDYRQVNGPIKCKDVSDRKSRIPRKQTGVRGAPHPSKPVRPPMWLSKAELTQEIQRLGTLCEARTKELNRLKMETKHVSVGFDAFAALFKYMVEDLNALSVPMLSEDLEKTLKQLELAKQDLAYYEREVEEMKAHHSQELNDLSNKLFEVYQGEITELSAKHQEELNQLNYDHQKQIENLSTALQASSDEVQAKYELIISQLQQELTTQRDELQLFQDREIKDLEEKHIHATKTLQEHIEQLQKKCTELNQHSMSMEDAMRKDTDSKLQWVTARKIDLEKEVESLKAVLEMKNKELHSLRVQTLEMEKQLEDLPLAREKIKMLQARAEDLEALMIEKTKLERKLCTENEIIKDTYEKESKVNKRLSMENEELQWRIRQAENSLLSGSFSEVTEYPEDVENETTSPIKSPPAPHLSRSVFFTFIDKDDTTSQSPRSQYRKITPGFSTNYKTSPGKTLNSVPSPRRAKSHSEPPQPPTLSCTPRKMPKQFSSKQKSTPKRQRSGSDCGRPTNEHAEVNFSSITGSMASSFSSESSVFEHKEQLLEEHEEQIIETLQILHEQQSAESPTEEPSTPNSTEKEWCNGESKITTLSPDFENVDMSRSSEFSDPKTYYHMTFPVPKEAGTVDGDAEDAGKNTSEGSTPSKEEPENTTHSMAESDISNITVDLLQIVNNATQCPPNKNPQINTNVSVKPDVQVDDI